MLFQLRTSAAFWLFLGLVIGAEVLGTYVNATAGVLVHALLLVCGVSAAANAADEPRRLLAASLLLVPALRLLSLALPLALLPQYTWYAAIGAPLLVMTWALVRYTRLPPAQIGLQPGAVVLEVALTVAGIGLGALAYGALGPTELAPSSGPPLWVLALSLFLLNGVLEEVMFRGLLQRVALPVIGRGGLIYVALLYAALQIGNRSAAGLLLMFAAALLFGQIVRWGGSVLGVALAHGTANLVLLVGLPLLAQRDPALVSQALPYLVWAGGLALAVVFGVLRWRALLVANGAASWTTH